VQASVQQLESKRPRSTNLSPIRTRSELKKGRKKKRRGDWCRDATNAPDVEEVGDAEGADACLHGAEEGLVRLEVEPVDARVRQARLGDQPPRRRRIAAEEHVLPPRHGGRAVVLLPRRRRRERDEVEGGEDGLQLGVGQDGLERGRVPQGQLLRHLLDGHPQLAAAALRRLAAGRRSHCGVCLGLWVGKEGRGRRRLLALFMCETGIVFESEKREMASLKGSRRGAARGGGDREAVHWDSLCVWQYL
jgi:hypothetical protein